MSEAFTPGPWEVSYDDQNGQAVVASEHTEIATCWHHSVGSLERQMRHNATLIAAAPELYEALRELMYGPGETLAITHVKARTALAKARGDQ